MYEQLRGEMRRVGERIKGRGDVEEGVRGE